MIKVNGYGAVNKSASIAPISFERRDVGENDVLIDILYCIQLLLDKQIPALLTLPLLEISLPIDA